MLTGGKRPELRICGMKLENATTAGPGHLFQTDRRIDKDNTTIVGGARAKAADVKGRISQIRAQIEETTSATTTVRSCRNVWPSWRAASPSSASVLHDRDRDEGEEGTASRTLCSATRAAVEEGIVVRWRCGPVEIAPSSPSAPLKLTRKRRQMGRRHR